MARPNKIWYRKDVGWWMVTIAGKKIRLAEGKGNRKLAEQKFHELKAAEPERGHESELLVAHIVESFLAWTKIHRSSETNRNHIYYGQQFAEHSGYLKAIELKPNHLTAWVDEHKWGQTTERNARRSVYRAFSWAVEEGLLKVNPLSGMKCPAGATRKRAMSDEEFRKLMRVSKAAFKRLLFALRMTGCRPKEARTLTWDKVHGDRWVLPEHKTAAKTGKPRVVYLTAPMQRLMTVMRRNTNGSAYVFLNCRGMPWTSNSLRLRIAYWKDKLNLAEDLCAYHARHAFGTSAILNGVDPVTVAQLMGHTSLEMIQKVYVHLAGEHQHLQNAVEQATKRRVSATLPSDAADPSVQSFSRRPSA